MPDTQKVEEKVYESHGSWEFPRDLDSAEFWRLVCFYLIHKSSDEAFAVIRLDELNGAWQAEVLMVRNVDIMVLRRVQRLDLAPP
ncbi:MAG: hypothetical protein ACM3S5_12350, partial [Rhodospirillales bacterium]